MAIGSVATPSGKPFSTPAGDFVRYRVLPSRSADPRKRAIADARVMARVAGFKVVDVVAAVEQPYGDEFLVELQVQA